MLILAIWYRRYIMKSFYLHEQRTLVNDVSDYPFEKYATGQSVSRLEDPRLVTGNGCFTDDFSLPKQAYGYIFRSPYAHGHIKTLDVAAAKQAGVPIALGSDWGPSGTKNLLGELKVAQVVGDELGGLFTAEELCAMVTTTPAEILGWGGKIGRVEAGKIADLLVLDADPTLDIRNMRALRHVMRAGELRDAHEYRRQE